MERRAWLEERRAAAEELYDRFHAATYDDDDSTMTPTHRRFVAALIDSCPPGGTILDVPCGTGRYFGMVVAGGRHVVGVDQSAGMLARARAKHENATLRKGRVEELEFDREFDAAMCIDSMEYVGPEDWPRVLGNLRRAVRDRGLIYLTVEQVDAAEIADVFNEATLDGLPVVHGEHVGRGGGYHHYPTEDQVAGWLADARLEVVDEGRNSGRTYWYRHVLLRSPGDDR